MIECPPVIKCVFVEIVNLYGLMLYVGVLESPEDFESSAELYDAVGGMILEADGSHSEKEETEEGSVQWICDQLFSAMRGLEYCMFAIQDSTVTFSFMHAVGMYRPEKMNASY